jgi:hypothetical protein
MNESNSRSFNRDLYADRARRRSMIVRYRGCASRAISSAGERFVHTEEATGSIPVSPTSKPAGQRLVPRPAGFFVPAMCPPGSPFRERLAGRRGHVRGHSVETELVALDVLHHEARLVVAIGRQQSHAYRAERDQSCAFDLKCGQALFTHEPGADPHVKMQPILDDLALGNALEEQSRAYTRGINACER